MQHLCFNIFFSAICLSGILGVEIGKHDPARFSSFRAFPWIPVDLYVHYDWPERSARFAGREVLGIGPAVTFNVIVTSAWGYGWNTGAGRYGMYYVHFQLRYKTVPFTRYQCSAWVHWPPPFPVHLDGIPSVEYNYCVPF
ncbi:uncharacterized protein LOC132747777 [Ruditapes philippinarum]|uniref:uncharacterized protein LOC132747777 n=1 Tax=Ruditapes philippinarum TaxID=129788 RepID=UPI00295AD108|nr:uncharacterized protein LOC132747777 [Ruditapes philippinarum]